MADLPAIFELDKNIKIWTGYNQMSYKGRRFYLGGNVIEVEEYHTGRYGAPGQERVKRRKPTPEQMERVNQRNREKNARRKLRVHFQEHDYFSTLTYRREERPGNMEEASADWKKFLRIVRDEYRKRGAELKWMRNIEVGKRDAWHIHLVINRIPDTDVILAKAWKHGGIHNQLLYRKGDFKELAAYITKNEKTDPRLKEARYRASNNLPIPEPEEKVYEKWGTWHKVRIPEGWYLEPDSLHEGINPVTGYKYRTYTLLRLERRSKEWRQKGRSKNSRKSSRKKE